MSSHRWAATVLVLLSLGVAGCSAATSATDNATVEKPAKVEAIAGKNVKSVTLTEMAQKRVGIETTQVVLGPNGQLNVPYQTVLYTPDGGTWVYAVTATRTYVREQVVVTTVTGATGETAVLSSGPAVGTTIVKTGAIELYGAELGVGK